MGYSTNDPNDAYRFAKGEATLPIAQAAPTPPNVSIKISKPLDFVAVTPHAEMMATVLCLDDTNAEINPDIYNSETCKDIREYKIEGLFAAEHELLRPQPQPSEEVCPPTESDQINPICVEATKSRWEEIQTIADNHYDEGNFTTFIGYEHTPAIPINSGGGTFHRNIIFRGGSDSVPESVFSAYDTYTASELWRKLDETCNAENNCQALVIPHMINLSNGMFFAKEDRQDHKSYKIKKLTFSTASPNSYTPEDYERRERLEPLIEIHQTKGNSECLLGAGTTDEFCQFESQVIGSCETFDQNSYPDVNCRQDSYTRNGLKKGLVLAGESAFGGHNPFKYGFIGSTDNQQGTPGATDEFQYVAQGGVSGATPEGSLTVQPKTVPLRAYNPGGLAGVWAEKNSREAIFDALKRKEVFGTSGTRITVRFFAGWDYPSSLHQYPKETMLQKAYQNGTPMGGDIKIEDQKPTIKSLISDKKPALKEIEDKKQALKSLICDKKPALKEIEDKKQALKSRDKKEAIRFWIKDRKQAPKFLVWAAKDPLSANLQRLQIIKGWEDTDGTHEQVYDVACSDGLEPDRWTHRCPDNGAKVDLKGCNYSEFKGATELKVTWTDPDFDPSRRAFYYARVLENPTCRWSTYDAKELGIELVNEVAPTIQERAWSSPIWYTPSTTTKEIIKERIVEIIKKKGKSAILDKVKNLLKAKKPFLQALIENRNTGSKKLPTPIIKALLKGKTVTYLNLRDGSTSEVLFTPNGKRVINLGPDHMVSTPYEIRDDQLYEQSSLDKEYGTSIYSIRSESGYHYIACDSRDNGYCNWEIIRK